jgi:predicted negative regulator of RcsB-dependent stress response
MPKAIKKVVVRKSEDEQYQESVHQLRDRLQERQRLLVKVGVAVLAALVIAAGVFVYMDNAKTKAAAYELEAYRHLAGADPASAKLPTADRVKKALDAFTKAYAERKSTDLRFAIGLCYFDLGNLDEAIKVFQEVGESSDARFAGLGLYKVAMIQLKKGDADKALAALNRVALTRNAPLQDLALIEGGKILASQGKTEEAKVKFQEVITKFPNSASAAEAKASLGAQK